MQPGLTRLHLQAGDYLIELADNPRVHVSLNYQPSTLKHSGSLFPVAPVLRPPAGVDRGSGSQLRLD